MRGVVESVEDTLSRIKGREGEGFGEGRIKCCLFSILVCEDLFWCCEVSGFQGVIGVCGSARVGVDVLCWIVQE